VCPFGSEIVRYTIQLMCFQTLSREKTSLAGMFGGVMAPGKPPPNETLAFGSSIVSAFKHACIGSQYFQIRDAFLLKFSGKEALQHGCKYDYMLEKIKLYSSDKKYSSIMLAMHKLWNQG